MEQTSVDWPGRHILTISQRHPELERLRCGNDGQAQLQAVPTWPPLPCPHEPRVATAVDTDEHRIEG